jgi:hypothetical protein
MKARKLQKIFVKLKSENFLDKTILKICKKGEIINDPKLITHELNNLYSNLYKRKYQ